MLHGIADIDVVERRDGCVHHQCVLHAALGRDHIEADGLDRRVDVSGQQGRGLGDRIGTALKRDLVEIGPAGLPVVRIAVTLDGTRPSAMNAEVPINYRPRMSTMYKQSDWVMLLIDISLKV